MKKCLTKVKINVRSCCNHNIVAHCSYLNILSIIVQLIITRHTSVAGGYAILDELSNVGCLSYQASPRLGRQADQVE
jgi:predicted short-subunit dehydrogenase-like oxidoreductase (DUF2520 family)